MSREKRLRTGYVGPFCKPLTPPLVILGGRMKLRQVECNETCAFA